MLLDCRSLDTTYSNVPDDWKIVVLDTGVHHELADGEYAKRQTECKVGLEAIKVRYPNVELLRDATMTMLDECKADMNKVAYKRCRHAITENDRALAFVKALNEQNEPVAGDLLAGSHKSLKDNYEVSCAELDKAVEIANTLPGLVGARMTGGGFGGSTVNLVQAQHAEAFRIALEDRYIQETGNDGHALLLTPSDGAKGGPLGSVD